MTDAKHEAPAKGAGEREEIARIIDPAAFLFAADELMKGDPSQFNALSKADRILDLRARSSAPEAREDGYRRVDLGMVATTIETMHRRIEELTGSRQSQYDGAVSLARDLYLTAAPSADKLRKEVTRDQIMGVVRQYAAPAWCSVDRMADALVAIMSPASTPGALKGDAKP